MTTWTRAEMVRHDKITLSLVDAPTVDDVQSVRVAPSHLTLWITNDELTRIGCIGNIIAGPGRDSGGHLAYMWPTDRVPQWARDLAAGYLAEARKTTTLPGGGSDG